MNLNVRRAGAFEADRERVEAPPELELPFSETAPFVAFPEAILLSPEAARRWAFGFYTHRERPKWLRNVFLAAYAVGSAYLVIYSTHTTLVAIGVIIISFLAFVARLLNSTLDDTIPL
jgi:hypothetical protein